MKTVIGMFRDFSDADAAYFEIKALGYTDAEISIVAPHDAAVNHQGAIDSLAEGAAEGAASGGVIGGMAGLLVGLGALTVPGIGPIIAVGPLLSMLTATAVGAGIGAATGGLMGALIDLEISEEEAHAYVAGVKEGNVLVMVNARGGDVRVIKDIMAEEGAIDIQARMAGKEAQALARHRVR